MTKRRHAPRVHEEMKATRRDKSVLTTVSRLSNNPQPPPYVTWGREPPAEMPHRSEGSLYLIGICGRISVFSAKTRPFSFSWHCFLLSIHVRRRLRFTKVGLAGVPADAKINTAVDFLTFLRNNAENNRRLACLHVGVHTRADARLDYQTECERKHLENVRLLVFLMLLLHNRPPLLTS